MYECFREPSEVNIYSNAVNFILGNADYLFCIPPTPVPDKVDSSIYGYNGV